MKKLLLLSDIHGHGNRAAEALARHPDIDTILIAGDITNFGDVDQAKAVMRALGSAGNERVICAVAGNCDPAAARRYLRSEGFDVEGSLRDFPYARLVGAGGGLRRAGITSFERSESELEAALGPQLWATKEKGKDKPLIVLTHTPPYGTNADRHAEKHVGSRIFARLMLDYCPDVWICGHIHESTCVSLEDGTLVVNPGPCGCGCHAVLEIGSSPDGEVLVRAELFR